MTKFYFSIINVIFVLFLAGCGVTSVTMLVLSLPGGVAPPQQVEFPGYTLGPISSDEFPDLLHDAIATSEGIVHIYGQVEWSGLQERSRYFKAVAAITNTDILLLKWHEPEEQYKIVTQLPYSEILSVSAMTWGAGRPVYLYFDDKEVSLGDQNYKIEGKTTFTFIKASNFRMDRKKNEAVFLFLQSKIKLHEGPPLTPDDSFDDDY